MVWPQPSILGIESRSTPWALAYSAARAAEARMIAAAPSVIWLAVLATHPAVDHGFAWSSSVKLSAVNSHERDWAFESRLVFAKLGSAMPIRC